MLFIMIQRSGVSLTVTSIVMKTYTQQNFYLVFDQKEFFLLQIRSFKLSGKIKREHPYLKFRTTLKNEQGENHKQTINKSTM